MKQHLSVRPVLLPPVPSDPCPALDFLPWHILVPVPCVFMALGELKSHTTGQILSTARAPGAVVGTGKQVWVQSSASPLFEPAIAMATAAAGICCAASQSLQGCSGWSPSPGCKSDTSHMPSKKELRPPPLQSPQPWPAQKLLPSYCPSPVTCLQLAEKGTGMRDALGEAAASRASTTA